ncbi:hypothetical protein AWB82_06178 [Caballeronia glebae]|uniref:Lipoprotein n=1 Tax=Caballeronia glebae TaxID=1777143 RepID=A0A158D2C3_9BURK|nr:hypothetical protein AWB82_06178 [Caballeronia glebae]
MRLRLLTASITLLLAGASSSFAQNDTATGGSNTSQSTYTPVHTFNNGASVGYQSATTATGGYSTGGENQPVTNNTRGSQINSSGGVGAAFPMPGGGKK